VMQWKALKKLKWTQNDDLLSFCGKAHLVNTKGVCKSGHPLWAAIGPTLKILLFLRTYGLSSGFVDFMFIKVKTLWRRSSSIHSIDQSSVVKKKGNHLHHPSLRLHWQFVLPLLLSILGEGLI
jgi:hypothetical protein